MAVPETGPIAIRMIFPFGDNYLIANLVANEQGELWIEGIWLAKREQTQMWLSLKKTVSVY